MVLTVLTDQIFKDSGLRVSLAWTPQSSTLTADQTVEAQVILHIIYIYTRLYYKGNIHYPWLRAQGWSENGFVLSLWIVFCSPMNPGFSRSAYRCLMSAETKGYLAAVRLRIRPIYNKIPWRNNPTKQKLQYQFYLPYFLCNLCQIVITSRTMQFCDKAWEISLFLRKSLLTVSMQTF